MKGEGEGEDEGEEEKNLERRKKWEMDVRNSEERGREDMTEEKGLRGVS